MSQARKSYRTDLVNLDCSTVAKLFTCLLKHTLTKRIQEGLVIEQEEFHSGFSVLDHIHTLNQLIEKEEEYNIKVYNKCVSLIGWKAIASIIHICILEA